MARRGRVRRSGGVFVNPKRRARRKVCKQLGITNKRFRKLNRKYHFTKYDYLNQQYRLDPEFIEGWRMGGGTYEG